MYIYGYRIGMLMSGAIALMLADQFSWNIVYYFVAIIMIIGIFTTLIADESQNNKNDKKALCNG